MNACRLCEKTFARPWVLRRHITEVHGEIEFPCDNCGKVYKRQEFLAKHEDECRPTMAGEDDASRDVDVEETSTSETRTSERSDAESSSQESIDDENGDESGARYENSESGHLRKICWEISGQTFALGWKILNDECMYLRECWWLNLLYRSDGDERFELIYNASPSQVDALCEIVTNIDEVRIPVKDVELMDKVYQYSHVMKLLMGRDLKFQDKRRLLLKHCDKFVFYLLKFVDI